MDGCLFDLPHTKPSHSQNGCSYKKLVFKSSLLVNGYCDIQVRGANSSDDLCLPFCVILILWDALYEADIITYIFAVRHPWRGACMLTWPYTYVQWGTPDVVRARWHDLKHMRSEAPLTWCVHADMTLYICAVRHPWRGACTLTGRGVCATCASTTSPSSSPARAACLWPTVAPPAGKRSDLCNDDIQRLLH